MLFDLSCNKFFSSNFHIIIRVIVQLGLLKSLPLVSEHLLLKSEGDDFRPYPAHSRLCNLLQQTQFTS